MGTKPLHILVAEENTLNRAVIKDVLGHLGHTCDIANDGKEAYVLFCAEPGKHDLVITDRDMPRMDGDALALLVKRSVPTMPVIMLTGHGAGMNHISELPNGVDILLGKPWGIKALKVAIELLTNPNASKEE